MSAHDEHDRVAFDSFDRDAEVEVTERNLPHWFQVGAAIFVTLRTADSLPRDVLLRWQRELEQWLNNAKLPIELAVSVVECKRHDHDGLMDQLNAVQRREFKRLSDRIFHRSLDECHGACLLRRPELANIVADAILFYAGDRYDLDRFVVMPNHVHAIVQFRPGADLQTISQSWMRFTGRKINHRVGNSGAFWQPEPFDHIIRSPEQFEYLQGYIADNPSKANLKSGDFVFWEGPR